jgi:hypothetical protein
MAHENTSQSEPEQRFEERIRRALATPPIGNEEILRRSKERRNSK